MLLFLSVYVSFVFLRTQVIGIIAITNIRGDRLSPWKIPRLIRTSPSCFPPPPIIIIIIIIDRDSISVYFVFVHLILYYRPRFNFGLFCFCSSYTLLFIYLFIDRDTISVYFVFVTVILYYYLFIYLLFRQIVILCHTVSQKLTIKSPSNFLCILSNV